MMAGLLAVGDPTGRRREVEVEFLRTGEAGRPGPGHSPEPEWTATGFLPGAVHSAAAPRIDEGIARTAP